MGNRIIMRVQGGTGHRAKTVTIPQMFKHIEAGDYVEIIKIEGGDNNE